VPTTDRTAIARPGLGDRVPGRAPPGRLAGWWRGWFAPAAGLRPQPVDVLLALVVAFVQVAGTIVYSQDEPPSPWAFDAFACMLLVAGPVALLLRRRWPEATLVVAFAAAAGYAAGGYPRGPAGFPAFVLVVVSAIMMGRRALARGVLALAYAAFTWLPFVLPDAVEQARGVGGEAANLIWLPLVGTASEIARSRLERRADRAHAAWEEARRRASEERLRIARELHDVLAHSISLINVQSGVALHLLDNRPEQARPALEAINEASEEALGELRSVLDVLRGGLGEDGAGSEPAAWAPRTPTAGLRDLDGLVRRTRAAGLDVRLAVEGEARSLPAGVDLAAYRCRDHRRRHRREPAARRAGRAGDPGRCRGARPGRRPPRRRRARRPPGGVARHERGAGPAQRDAQPAAQRQQRRRAADRRGRRVAVHRRRCVAQAVD
jgi:hypothetical protein